MDKHYTYIAEDTRALQEPIYLTVTANCCEHAEALALDIFWMVYDMLSNEVKLFSISKP